MKQLTAETVYAFSVGLLQHRYDNPRPTPEFHKELWAYCCLPDKRVAIAAPRGHAKSTAVTLAYTLACALFRVKEYIIIVSDTEPQSIQFLNSIKGEIIENEALRDVFFIDKLVKDNEKDIIVQMKDGHQFRITAKSSNQAVRGLKWGHRRPDLIICDDLENDEIVMNQERRQKFREWFFNALMPTMSDTGTIRIVGTILHFDSLLERLMPQSTGNKRRFTKSKGLKTYSTEPNRPWKAVKFRAHSDYNDFSKILWKEKFSEERLLTIRSDYEEQGFPEGYSQEYLNYPIAEGNSYFRGEDFLPMDGNDLEAHGEFYAAGDFAISKEESADYTVIVVGKLTSDNILHIVDVRRGRWDSREIIEEVLSVQLRYNINMWTFEAGQIEKSLGPFLEDEMFKRGVFLNIHKEKPIKDKPQRARAIQGRHRMGGVKFNQEASWYPDLEQEMRRFPRGRHDDQVDAMAYLGLMLNKMLPGRTEKELEDEMYEEMLNEYYSNYDGRSAVTGY